MIEQETITEQEKEKEIKKGKHEVLFMSWVLKPKRASLHITLDASCEQHHTGMMFKFYIQLLAAACCISSIRFKPAVSLFVQRRSS